MNCEDCAEELSARLDGELSEERTAEVDAHLGECVTCRASYAALRRVDHALARVELPELRAGALELLKRRIATEEGTDVRRFSWRRAGGIGGMGIAAAAAVLALYLVVTRPADEATRLARQTEAVPAAGDSAPDEVASLEHASDEELALAVEFETVEDYEVIANLELLEALLALEAETG